MDLLWGLIILLIVFWVFGIGFSFLGGLAEVLFIVILALLVWKIVLSITERKK